MCIAIVCKPKCDAMNFEANVIFLIKPSFLHDRKMVAKTFFIIFRGFSSKQIRQTFLEGESPTLSTFINLY